MRLRTNGWAASTRTRAIRNRQRKNIKRRSNWIRKTRTCASRSSESRRIEEERVITLRTVFGTRVDRATETFANKAGRVILHDGFERNAVRIDRCFAGE